MGTRQPRLYVVEFKSKGKWLPTVECGIYRRDAEVKLRSWRADYPEDKVRIAPYVAATVREE